MFFVNIGRYLPSVFDRLVRKIILNKRLLHNDIAAVFFVSQDRSYNASIPDRLLSSDSRHTCASKVVGNYACRLPAQIRPKNKTDNFGFLFNNKVVAIIIQIVSKQARTARNTDCIPFSDSPLNRIGLAGRFFLRL